MSRGHPAGKLPSELLGGWLSRYAHKSPELLVGAGVGRDAAVIDLGGETVLVAKTDPITFATDRIGDYAVIVNANDVACMGARPRWFLACVLLPRADDNQSVGESIFRQIDGACRAHGIVYCGGHTEVTLGIDRPIVVGQMLGTAAKSAIVRIDDARPGDAVIVTRGAAIEATSIMAREKAAVLEEEFGADFVRRCGDFLDDPGISVVDAALALAGVDGVRAIHDPTEGGVLAGIRELGLGAGTGVELDADLAPVYEETRRLCEYFGLDPLRIIASGMLAVVAAPEAVDAALAAMDRIGVPARVVGRLVEPEMGFRLKRQGRWSDFPESDIDQITGIF